MTMKMTAYVLRTKRTPK